MSKGTSSGKRKLARADKNCARSGKAKMNLAGEEQVRNEANRRWPTKETEQKYFELNIKKAQAANRPAKRIKPPVLGFALLESLSYATLDRILTCSSLKLKRVKRYPGWILQSVYSLKNRPIDFTM